MIVLFFDGLLPQGTNSLPMLSVLFIGLVLGLKHAVEADHLAAVSTVVSERKSISGAALVGGMWGVGHTISLLIAGVAVLLLRLEISRRVEMALEFCVALMLIGLGANALRKLLSASIVHFHAHRHGDRWHTHPHMHGDALEPAKNHHNFRHGARPLVVGMMHGLAGSAALMLLVLAAIPSPVIGLAYIGVFGVGSIGGMILMSAIVGLPVYLTARRWTRTNLLMRWAAGLFSLGCGVFMVYEIGFIEGLFR